VAVEPWVYCGRCIYCVEGKYNLCLSKKGMGTNEWQGSFAEYAVAPEKAVYRLPSNVSYEEGFWLSLLLCVYMWSKRQR